MFLFLEGTIARKGYFEDKTVLWHVSLNLMTSHKWNRCLDENIINDIDDFLNNHTAFFREVKPFLSNYGRDSHVLILRKENSPKYGRNITLVDIGGEDVRTRGFRTHAGNYGKDSNGCWIWSKDINIQEPLLTKNFIASNTKAAVQKFHEVMDIFDAIYIHAEVMR